MNRLRYGIILSITLIGFSSLLAQKQGSDKLAERIKEEFGKNKGFFALAFRNVDSGEELLINEREPFHAASTMKTPVMIELYKQAKQGKFSLTDSIVIKNEFKSIVDGSLYQLNPADDSEFGLYKIVGQKRPLYDVMYQMIIASSNLATNILIEKVDARKVTETIRGMGAQDLMVLRGVEDSKAFAKGLNNSVTAYDLMLLFDAIANGKAVSVSASGEMIKILLDQKFSEIIPALLPTGVRVAHKTGSIRGVQHDSGIVLLPDGRKYTLVILSKGLTEEKSAIQSMALVSKMVYDYFKSN